MSHNKSFEFGTFVFLIPLLALLLSAHASPLTALQKPEPLAEVEAGADFVAFQPLVDYAGVRVTVSGPDGFEIVQSFGPKEAPMVDLPGVDGLYKYELRFSPAFTERELELLREARESGAEVKEPKNAAKRTVQSGSFTLAGGSVVLDLDEPEPEKAVLTSSEGVIRNSLCVGFDCPNTPTFDDSTVLMMENNTRIKFGDTSNSPFPNNDWEIEANSSLSGGLSYLGFNDCGSADNDGGCATDLVFAVEAGARASALYVQSDGDVGLGTANPVLDLHIVTGNTPALRLDQDGSSGFTPQVWDIAGNETNFFVRDVTAGSRLPFRIRPGAPTSSIDIANNGDVGVGTSAPSASLHVRRTNASAKVLVEEASGTTADRELISIQNNGGTGFLINDTSRPETWSFLTNVNGNFLINSTAAAGSEFVLNGSTGTLTLKGGLITGTPAGTCNPGPCDAVFTDYELESIEEHAAYMWENSHLWGVGPTREGEPMNLTKKTAGILHELEKAHIYIEQLNERLKQKDVELVLLSEHLNRKDEETVRINERLQRLEALLAAQPE